MSSGTNGERGTGIEDRSDRDRVLTNVNVELFIGDI